MVINRDMAKRIIRAQNQGCVFCIHSYRPDNTAQLCCGSPETVKYYSDDEYPCSTIEIEQGCHEFIEDF